MLPEVVVIEAVEETGAALMVLAQAGQALVSLVAMRAAICCQTGSASFARAGRWRAVGPAPGG
ncbi:hypothetical protein K2224_33715 (plasmid) [Streptomyces sp. BHT-5-2]|uniref:hypothetical protein n=1 Tax=unclassified Streptomyces TaxID=2593676 RepID=UPI001C8E9511|nr:hypothetical protein [Streptomyces sp. BHT-5-2]QZL08108.1 hypothetical protein K2224_33715 [Streptomyces sp. BHT-5-2]